MSLGSESSRQGRQAAQTFRDAVKAERPLSIEALRQIPDKILEGVLQEFTAEFARRTLRDLAAIPLFRNIPAEHPASLDNLAKSFNFKTERYQCPTLIPGTTILSSIVRRITAAVSNRVWDHGHTDAGLAEVPHREIYAVLAVISQRLLENDPGTITETAARLARYGSRKEKENAAIVKRLCAEVEEPKPAVKKIGPKQYTVSPPETGKRKAAPQPKSEPRRQARQPKPKAPPAVQDVPVEPEHEASEEAPESGSNMVHANGENTAEALEIDVGDSSSDQTHAPVLDGAEPPTDLDGISGQAEQASPVTVSVASPVRTASIQDQVAALRSLANSAIPHIPELQRQVGVYLPSFDCGTQAARSAIAYRAAVAYLRGDDHSSGCNHISRLPHEPLRDDPHAILEAISRLKGSAVLPSEEAEALESLVVATIADLADRIEGRNQGAN